MGWDRFWSLKPEELIVWLAILAALIAVGVYVAMKIRAKTVQQEPQASELLSKFRDLHSQGELSDEEFRTIKTTLSAQLQKELVAKNHSPANSEKKQDIGLPLS